MKKRKDKFLKIGTLNEKLDELVRANGPEKPDVLRWLILHTSPEQMKWIVDIILTKTMRVAPKHPELGIGDNLALATFDGDMLARGGCSVFLQASSCPLLPVQQEC